MDTFQPTIDFVSAKTYPSATFLEQILAFLDGRMTRPGLYGWYHLLCLAITIGLCVLVVFKAKNLSNKQFNLIIGITAGTMILLEIYKQLNFSYDVAADTWSYQWYAFPFQFCATPMYILLLASLLKEGKVKNALCSYMATYGLFAGTAVMLYPGDVFMTVIGINIQTMIHHGVMVVMGVLMYVSGRVKISHKAVLHGLPVFAICVSLALGANILYHYFGDPNQSFNMFYISPFERSTLPVLNIIYGEVPYVVFLAVYVFGFTLAGYLMSLFAMGIAKLQAKVQTWMKTKKENV